MSTEKPSQVADDLVVTIEYELTVDGEIVDSSAEEGPLEYLHGYQNIIPGLEAELLGLKVGDSKTVVVPPAGGYGDYDEDEVVEVEIDEFPEDLPLEVGLELEVADDDGFIMLVTVLEVGDETVKLDANHPLAGKDLHFKVKVLAMRAATEEELEHGHVHGEDSFYDDEDEDED